MAEKWKWNNFDTKTVREKLNQYIKLRGDVVHRSRPGAISSSTAHAVTKDDLEKAISFLRSLVAVTEAALASPT